MGKLLGPDLIEALIVAIFNDYGFGPDLSGLAVGLPDLLVWHPAVERGLWSFVEIKGPRDSIRRSQREWMQAHGDLIHGHMLFLSAS